MANTDVTLTSQDGSVFSDNAAITVFDGDTFTVTSNGGVTALLFSPDLAASVSPETQVPITLTDGQRVEFTFTSSDPAGYFIAYGPAGVDIDLAFPPELSTTVHLQGPLEGIEPPPPPPLPVIGGVTTPPKGGTGPILNPQGAD